MGANSKIAWCHHTFNIVIGCSKVSPGCDNCYAERGSKRMGVVWGPDGDRRELSDPYWKQPHAWNRRAEADGERHRVFCSSMADVFEANEALVEPRMRLAKVIRETPHLDWLLLTKRPENMVRLARRDMDWDGAWPSNVWAGCTVEDQTRAEDRILWLAEVPARVRFLSCEPLLERVNLRDVDIRRVCGLMRNPHPLDPMVKLDALTGHMSGPDDMTDLRVHWVIIGGESGPKARAQHLEWTRQIVRDCKAAGVPAFVKQLGERAIDSLEHVNEWAAVGHPLKLGGTTFGPGLAERPFLLVNVPDRKGGDPDEWPEDLRVREVPR